MRLRPAEVDPQGGPITGKEGGPMSLAKPATKWSHVTGKRQAELTEIPCSSEGARRCLGVLPMDLVDAENPQMK